MKKKSLLEGKKYRLKRNSLNKIKNKYTNTYQYIINNILQYKKYTKQFNNTLKIDENKENVDKLLLKTIEAVAKEFAIDNTKLYSYNKLNKNIMKKYYKIRKEEKKNNIESNNKIIKLYKQIENKEYKKLRELAFKKTNLFLEAVYLYTICED